MAIGVRKKGYPVPPGNGLYNAMDGIEQQVGLNRFMNGQGSYGSMTQPRFPQEPSASAIDNMYDFYDGSNNADSIVSAPPVDNMYDFYDGSNNLDAAEATVAKANAPRKSKGRTKARRDVNKAVKDVGTPGTFNFNAAGQRMPNDWAGPSKGGSMNPFARDFDPSMLFGGDQRANDASYPQARGSYGFNANDPINLF